MKKHTYLIFLFIAALILFPTMQIKSNAMSCANDSYIIENEYLDSDQTLKIIPEIQTIYDKTSNERLTKFFGSKMEVKSIIKLKIVRQDPNDVQNTIRVYSVGELTDDDTVDHSMVVKIKIPNNITSNADKLKVVTENTSSYSVKNFTIEDGYIVISNVYTLEPYMLVVPYARPVSTLNLWIFILASVLLIIAVGMIVYQKITDKKLEQKSQEK